MNSLVGKVVAIGLVLLLAVVVPALSVYQIELLTQMLIYAIFAMSLDVLLGYTGLPSLGHAAYFGLAAYATAILSLALPCSLRTRGAGGGRSIGHCGRAFQSARAENLARLLLDDHAGALATALELGRELDGVDRRRQWSAWTRTAKIGLVPVAPHLRRWVFLPDAARIRRVYNRALGARAFARRLCAQGRAGERGTNASARIRRLEI